MEGFTLDVRHESSESGKIICKINDECSRYYFIVIWDHEADIITVEQSGFHKTQINKFKGMFTVLPDREEYSMTVQE